jgi:hypothetical protein
MGAESKKGVVELALLLGEPYLKTTHGPKLFQVVDFPTARGASASLNAFLQQLGI